METLERIKNDLTEALKAGDTVLALTLRYLLSEIHNAEIAKGKDAVLTEEELAQVLNKQVKQRRESIEAYKKGGRDDLVKKEQAELEAIQSYLPEQMGGEEIGKIVDAAILQVGASGPQDMGKVMGAVMAQVKGKADGSLVSKLVQERLTK
ncbi:GatB/YqeY domain-containing protein [Candidatus Saccharibacteria bacterium]|nr:GatB/YqeY domain-containing protein [Candidatus Saccharibacteria bacterium]